MSLIIGIGGVRATGKSTLARQLGVVLRADVLSSGRVRELLRAHVDAKNKSLLFESVTQLSDVKSGFDALIAQAEYMKSSLLRVVEQCRKREASLIIEGSHVIPTIFSEHFDLVVMLHTSEDKIRSRLVKDKLRHVDAYTLGRLVQLQNMLLSDAKVTGSRCIESSSLPKALVEIVQGIDLRLAPKTDFS